MKNVFNGVIVPLITPFDKGKIDYSSLLKIISRCKKGGASAFVCLGTTAEAPTITKRERTALVNFCLEQCYPLPVIVGAGSNCTREAIRLTRECERLGASGVLSVAPYYNKPSKTGIIEHFSQIAGSVSLPVILYNVPSRTGSDMDIDTITALSNIDNVVGIKEAGNDKNKLREISKITSEDFALFCGNDHLTLEALDCKCEGLISASANAITKSLSEIFYSHRKGDKVRAQNSFNAIKELIDCFYVEANPAPIKYALSKIGLCKNQLRLPMCPISHKNEQLLDKIISKINLEEV